ncbi:MAG: hypothetical protein ACQESC_03955 [Nanobdellota archaeon]
MDLKNFQKQSNELVENIDAKKSICHDIDTTAIHLFEEFGEVARQLFNRKSGREELDKENLAEEISDCMILLSRLACNFDIDIEKSVENKIKNLKEQFDV